jgi:hypothetical protein
MLVMISAITKIFDLRPIRTNLPLEKAWHCIGHGPSVKYIIGCIAVCSISGVKFRTICSHRPQISQSALFVVAASTLEVLLSKNRTTTHGSSPLRYTSKHDSWSSRSKMFAIESCGRECTWTVDRKYRNNCLTIVLSWIFKHEVSV